MWVAKLKRGDDSIEALLPEAASSTTSSSSTATFSSTMSFSTAASTAATAAGATAATATSNSSHNSSAALLNGGLSGCGFSPPGASVSNSNSVSLPPILHLNGIEEKCDADTEDCYDSAENGNSSSSSNNSNSSSSNHKGSGDAAGTDTGGLHDDSSALI
jgi:hypothetical protein